MRLLDYLKNTVLYPTNPPASTSLSTKEAYMILENDRRRRIVEYLAHVDRDEVALRKVADHLAEGDDDRDSAYISCIQVQFPKLHETGLVDYDDRAKVAVIRPELYTLYNAHKAFRANLDAPSSASPNSKSLFILFPD